LLISPIRIQCNAILFEYPTDVPLPVPAACVSVAATAQQQMCTHVHVFDCDKLGWLPAKLQIGAKSAFFKLSV